MPQQSSALMFLIAYDRLRLVTLGVQYTEKETSFVVLRRIFAAWIFTAVFYIPIQFADLMIEPENEEPAESDHQSRFQQALPLSQAGFCQTELFFSKSVAAIWLVVGNFIFPLCTVLVYGLVFIRIRQRRRTLLAKSGRTKEDEESPGRFATPARQLAEYAHYLRATRRMIVLTVIFLVTWLPCGITPFILEGLHGSDWACHHHSCREDLTGIHTIMVYLMYSNSFVNPLLYALTFPKMRAALKETFSCLKSLSPKLVGNRRSDSVLTVTPKRSLSLSL